MDYANGSMCARCRIRVSQIADCLGESGLYSPNRAFTLCELCFLEEESEIDERGTNDIPERIEAYRRNLRMGPLDFRSRAARCLAAVGTPPHPSE